MKILVGNKWREDFLDYYQGENEYRIKVLAWKNLEKLENVYHTRPKSIRLLLNYLSVVGPGGLFRKTWSRLREEYRNEKYTSCGIGEIVAAPETGKFKIGDKVGFVAPVHPALVERIALPEALIFNIDETPQTLPQTILYLALKNKNEKNNWWKDIRGWSPFSEIPISDEMRERLVQGIRNEFQSADWKKAQHFPIDKSSEIAEKRGEATKIKSGAKNAVLFGYGNYPKINNIPYSKPYIYVRSVHEIDPTQIIREGDVERWDTSPLPRPDEKYDVYFVASYNHTHAPIAVHALRQGADVVMEKPIAANYQQLEELTKALKQSGKRLFIGFQKRYSIFNEYARQDLGVRPGEPIDYHCIVFEIIQPKFFWYNWPSSKSRLFSNGCHLVDHFLYLNEYSEPKNVELDAVDDGTVNVWIELENGAVFTMAFSEKGSSRVGPRDHIELKTPGHNVRITDATRYFSENESRILRKKRVWKTEAYKRMYKTIGKKIVNNEPGDSLRSIVVSAKIMLEIEDKLKEALKKRGKTLF
jgi:predicted dehydrogenase